MISKIAGNIFFIIGGIMTIYGFWSSIIFLRVTAICWLITILIIWNVLNLKPLVDYTTEETEDSDKPKDL